MAHTNRNGSGQAAVLTAIGQPADNTDEMTAMAPDTPLAAAGRAILHKQLKKLQQAEPVAREGQDPEGVHAMRVATRRLRSALKVLEVTVFDPEITGHLRRKLRRLANALGESRDTDVFLEHLDSYDVQLPVDQRHGLKPLRQHLLDRQTRAHNAMVKTLDSPGTRKLLRRLEHIIDAPDSKLLAKRNKAPGAVLPERVRDFAGSTIWQRYEAVLAYETAIIPGVPVETLHRLRVACKQLRYTLEFFEEALPIEVKGLLNQLVQIQDLLGAIHDHQVAAELAGNLKPEQAAEPVLQAYRATRLAEMERLSQEVSEKWQSLAGRKFKNELALGLSNI